MKGWTHYRRGPLSEEEQAILLLAGAKTFDITCPCSGPYFVAYDGTPCNICGGDGYYRLFNTSHKGGL